MGDQQLGFLAGAHGLQVSLADGFKRAEWLRLGESGELCLRGDITDELRAEHSQHIASRELADEFCGLLKELALDRQEAMLKCCGSGKEYVESHREAFTGFADAHWQSALRT